MEVSGTLVLNVEKWKNPMKIHHGSEWGPKHAVNAMCPVENENYSSKSGHIQLAN